jgi:multiple sugar transport system substrate-binding protein
VFEKQVVPLYKKLHPEISIKIINIPENIQYHRKIQAMITGGTPPDVMLIDDEPFPGFAEKGIFLELGPFIKRDKYDMESFFPITRELFIFKGKIYGLPSGGGCYVIVYNKDLFDKAGMKYPQNNWTWDDFLRIAQKLTLDTNKDGRVDQWGYNLDFNYHPWIWESGGDVLTKKMDKCIIDSPQAIKGLQFFSDLLYKYKVSPLPYQKADLDLFLTGRIAMSPTAPFFFSYLKTLKFRWGLVMNPVGPTGNKFHRSRYTGNGFAILSKTRYVKESWEFLKFLSSVEVQKIIAKVGAGVPARIKVANSDAYLKTEKSDDIKLFVDALVYSRRELLPVQYNEMRSIIQDNLELLVSKGESAEMVARKIKTEVDAVLK